MDGNQLQQLSTYVLVAWTLFQIRSRLSLGILFTMEQEAVLPMPLRQVFDDDSADVP